MKILSALLFLLLSSGVSFGQAIKIKAVGDIMLGTNFPDPSYLPPHDGQFLLDSVKSILQDADITFGNLEGAYFDGEGKPKKCSDPKKCYAFRSPGHYLNYIQEAGFNMVSLANNHSGDFGIEPRQFTMSKLDSLGITYAGLESCPTGIFHLNDSVNIGFIAVAPNSGCLQLNHHEKVAQLVKHLDTTCQIVIVSFHGGAEGSAHQRVPQGTEYYLGENRGNLRLFSRTMIDAGADLILGHGPHVTRGIELYNNKLIAYSLGNFATYARFNLLGPNGICPILEVELAPDGQFLKGKIIAVKQIGEGVPILDPNKTVIQKMRELSTLDFPNSPLLIDDEGNILLKN